MKTLMGTFVVFMVKLWSNYGQTMVKLWSNYGQFVVNLRLIYVPINGEFELVCHYCPNVSLITQIL
jgi:hypothetical protein